MGRRRAFIDKKRATTYSLIYAGEGGAAGAGGAPEERLLVDAARKVGVGRPDSEAVARARQGEPPGTYPPGHPLEWLDAEPGEALSPERRQELLELGFPDDGYDYIKHLRAGGRQPVGLDAAQAQSGPRSEAEPAGSLNVLFLQ